MTYGMRFTNSSNITTISDNQKAYVYLGKYGPNNTSGEYTVDITCAGFPMVFMSVPYNVTEGDGGHPGSGIYYGAYIRSGAYVRRIEHLGGSSWRISVAVINASYWKVAGAGTGTVSPIPTTLRVFGRLDLNHPSGISGNPYGMRVWDSTGALVFDSNGRMLRLAGNTYDTELLLKKDYPGTSTGDPRADYNSYDTSVSLPFSLSGKSICATSRSLVRHYEASHAEYFDGTWEYTYNTYDWASAYWANGSTLYSRKVPHTIGTESFPYTLNISSAASDTYTRLAFIDDSQFP